MVHIFIKFNTYTISQYHIGKTIYDRLTPLMIVFSLTILFSPVRRNRPCSVIMECLTSKQILHIQVMTDYEAQTRLMGGASACRTLGHADTLRTRVE